MFTVAQEIQQMRNMAEILVEYSHPIASYDDERTVFPLKNRTMVIDGYDLTTCLTKADCGDYFQWSLQLQPVTGKFLPFHFVCKMGKMVLGKKRLSLVEFVRDGRKVYCWICLEKKDGKRMKPLGHQTEIYEGFKFRRMNPDMLDVY